MSSKHPSSPIGRRRFSITVDGVRHEVIVEELGDSSETSDIDHSDRALTSSGRTGRTIAEQSDKPAYSAGSGTVVQPSTGPTDLFDDKCVDQQMSGPLSSPADGSVDPPSSGTVAQPSREHIGSWVNAPMPGTVTEVAIKVGDDVEQGDVLLILTAMKLENEITAPVAGTVIKITVAVEDNVNYGDRLIQLKIGGTNL